MTRVAETFFEVLTDPHTIDPDFARSIVAGSLRRARQDAGTLANRSDLPPSPAARQRPPGR